MYIYISLLQNRISENKETDKTLIFTLYTFNLRNGIYHFIIRHIGKTLAVHPSSQSHPRRFPFQSQTHVERNLTSLLLSLSLKRRFKPGRGRIFQNIALLKQNHKYTDLQTFEFTHCQFEFASTEQWQVPIYFPHTHPLMLKDKTMYITPLLFVALMKSCPPALFSSRLCKCRTTTVICALSHYCCY